MKWFLDGDRICIVRDDFINLQESPVVFVKRDSDTGNKISKYGLSVFVAQEEALRNMLMTDEERVEEGITRYIENEEYIKNSMDVFDDE